MKITMELGSTFQVSYGQKLKLKLSFSLATWKRLPLPKEWKKTFLEKRKAFDYHTRFHHFAQQNDICIVVTNMGIYPPIILGRFWPNWTKLADGEWRTMIAFPHFWRSIKFFVGNHLRCGCGRITFHRCQSCGYATCKNCRDASSICDACSFYRCANGV